MKLGDNFLREEDLKVGDQYLFQGDTVTVIERPGELKPGKVRVKWENFSVYVDVAKLEQLPN